MRRSQAAQLSFSRSVRSTYADDSEAESLHQDALDAAHSEHERVRKIAEDALELAALRLEQLRLQETAEKEAERLRIEREHAALAARVIELQKTHIPVPKPPPRAPTPPPPAPPPQKEEPPKQNSPVQEAPRRPSELSNVTSNGHAVLSSSDERSLQKKPEQQRPAQTQFPPAPTPQKDPPEPPTISTTPKAAPPQPSNIPTKPQQPGALAAHILPGTERYREIHKNLKNLRKFMMDDAKENPALKTKMGEMRRGIRVSIGQLTDVKGANREPSAKILGILRESMTLNSTPVDPGMVMVTNPPPVEGSPDQLPSLFIYLLNILSKVVVSQFIDEAGVNPKAAEPIGVVAVSVFARAEFQWRGHSLIDILMAKMRIVCPVVFGVRGSDKTEEGRGRQGWWKENDNWVPDQTHNTRMTGLGAGYSSIALRDFSKTTMNNPWPPSLFWRSLASMVSTPDPSGTQYLVVKAMLDGYEQRFLSFYGSAGRAALKAALVDFPGRDSHKSVAGSSLATLGDKLRKDVGLKLSAAR